MTAIEIGRICIKTKGKEAGRKVVIVNLDKEGDFATIDGTRVKRKKCNLRHLFPTKEKIDIKRNAVHAVIVKLLKG